MKVETTRVVKERRKAMKLAISMMLHSSDRQNREFTLCQELLASLQRSRRPRASFIPFPDIPKQIAGWLHWTEECSKLQNPLLINLFACRDVSASKTSQYSVIAGSVVFHALNVVCVVSTLV